MIRALFSSAGLCLIVLTVFLSFFTPPIPPGRYVETLKPWPPELGIAYPDLELINQDGKRFKLSDFKGRVLLIQMIGMNNPACQTLSGSKKNGPFGKIDVLQGLDPIEESFPKYTKGLSFLNEHIVFIQILLYGMNFENPDAKDAKMWAKHFGLDTKNNQIVAVTSHDLRSSQSHRLIPGFHLVDKNFILQADASGPSPKDDLYARLLPLVPIALNAKKR